MSRPVGAVVAAVVVVGVGWYVYQQTQAQGQAAGAAFDASMQGAAQSSGSGIFSGWFGSGAGNSGSSGISGTIRGAFSGVKSMYDNLTASVAGSVSNPNVQAFLHLIRVGEGTDNPMGYSELFGGGHFTSYADHPDIAVPFGSTYSTAAGAYQILHSTWVNIQAQYGLSDFSPPNQDIAAVALIKGRGALGDVLNGDFVSAIDKCNKEWASLPGSPYGQPTLTMADAGNILASQGVQSNQVMA